MNIYHIEKSIVQSSQRLRGTRLVLKGLQMPSQYSQFPLFFLFLSPCLCLWGKIKYSQDILYTSQSFSFRDNGTMVLKLYNYTPASDIRIYALDSRQMRTNSIGKNMAKKYCLAPYDISRTRELDITLNNMTYQEITKKIPTDDIEFILYLVVFNCKKHSGLIEFHFYNPNTYLDKRLENIPYIYATTIPVYAVYTILWILNSLFYWRFRIDAHYHFILSFLLRTVSAYFNLCLWKQKSFYSDSSLPLLTFIVELCEIMSITYFLTTNMIVLLGWGVYRNNFPTNEYELSFLIIYLFLALKTLIYYTSNMLIIVVLFLLCNFFFILFMQLIFLGMVMASSITHEIESHPDPVAAAKIDLVNRFGKSFMTWYLVLLLTMYYHVTMSMNYYDFKGLEEFFYNILAIIDLLYFAFRKEYIPAQPDDETQLDAISDAVTPTESVFNEIKEPTGLLHAFITRPHH